MGIFMMLDGYLMKVVRGGGSNFRGFQASGADSIWP